jgi:general secretion pathway protein J
VAHRLRKEIRFASSGFTLIELLVALVVLSLVFLLLFSALQFGTKVWSSSQEDAGNTEQVLVVQSLLRRMLSESRPVIVEPEGTTPAHLLFVGTQTSLQFVAPMPTHLGTGGFYEIALHITKGDHSGNRLVMTWKLFRQPRASVNQLEKQRVLMEGIADLEFAYFGRHGQEATQWYSDWQDARSLPELIRVRLVQGTETWPDLIVSPMVQSVELIAPEPE